MKKYMAECFGTFILVFFGCGTAVVFNGINHGGGLGFIGVIGVAIAFGLSLVAAAYAIGGISGCHVNPAVSLAMFINKRISALDFIGYLFAQLVGAFIAAFALRFLVSRSSIIAIAYGLGQNGYGGDSVVGLDMWGSLICEIVLTFVFVMVVLGVTSSKLTVHMSGLVTGAALTLVHIIGTPLTGTSVNPARSIAPAIVAWDLDSIAQLWVFVIGPFAGAIIAALVYKFILNQDELKN